MIKPNNSKKRFNEYPWNILNPIDLPDVELPPELLLEFAKKNILYDYLGSGAMRFYSYKDLRSINTHELIFLSYFQQLVKLEFRGFLLDDKHEPDWDLEKLLLQTLKSYPDILFKENLILKNNVSHRILNYTKHIILELSKDNISEIIYLSNLIMHFQVLMYNYQDFAKIDHHDYFKTIKMGKTRATYSDSIRHLLVYPTNDYSIKTIMEKEFNDRYHEDGLYYHEVAKEFYQKYDNKSRYTSWEEFCNNYFLQHDSIINYSQRYLMLQGARNRVRKDVNEWQKNLHKNIKTKKQKIKMLKNIKS